MPPLSSASGYTPGSSYTNTSGADFGPADYARALLQREATMPMPAQRRPVPMGVRGPSYAAPPEVPVITRGPMAKTHLQRARETDELMQMQARQQPAPMRGLTGFNMIGSASGMDVVDPSQMNAYQRAAYLPSGSSFVPTGITAASSLSAERNPEPWDPYAGRRLEGPGVSLGPGADFARAQMANAARR